MATSKIRACFCCLSGYRCRSTWITKENGSNPGNAAISAKYRLFIVHKLRILAWQPHTFFRLVFAGLIALGAILIAQGLLA